MSIFGEEIMRFAEYPIGTTMRPEEIEGNRKRKQCAMLFEKPHEAINQAWTALLREITYRSHCHVNLG